MPMMPPDEPVPCKDCGTAPDLLRTSDGRVWYACRHSGSHKKRPSTPQATRAEAVTDWNRRNRGDASEPRPEPERPQLPRCKTCCLLLEPGKEHHCVRGDAWDRPNAE
jgi:hypothetical protein